MPAEVYSAPSRRHPATARKGPSCLTISLTGIVFAACLLTLATLGLGVGLPLRVERTFGPASSALGPFDRVILSLSLLMAQHDLTQPVNSNGAEVEFSIQLGDDPASVALRLQSQGLINNASAFRDYLVYSGQDRTVQAGVYHLSQKMTPIEIARLLQDSTPSEVLFYILAGWRMEEIAAALPTSGLNISSTVFLDAAATRPLGFPFLTGLPGGANLEGFLSPGEYTLRRDLTADELIYLLLSNFQAQLTPDLQAGFEQQNLSLYEAVTLASIVEREAVIDDEMPRIAGVFLNRLAADMKLDSDPTVQYALGYNFRQSTWWTNPLSLDDLQAVSPYNTYQNRGLPPGPISNPGMSALRAVAFPEESPYYYFRATCDHSGRHFFARTFEEHLANACP